MTIQYLEGTHIDINQDNSFNDYLSVDEAGGNFGLKVSPMRIGFKEPDQEIISPEQAAEYFWRRFTARI